MGLPGMGCRSCCAGLLPCLSTLAIPTWTSSATQKTKYSHFKLIVGYQLHIYKCMHILNICNTLINIMVGCIHIYKVSLLNCVVLLMLLTTVNCICNTYMNNPML